MIWPQNLVLCTLLNTFHAEDDDGVRAQLRSYRVVDLTSAQSDGSMTRYRFFTYVFLAAGAWYILPNFLFSALSSFSFICWIWPSACPVRVHKRAGPETATSGNIKVNQLFGVVSGLGMSALTFDWGQIAYIGSPLIVPWWAGASTWLPADRILTRRTEVNVFVGFLFFFWFLTPILYYKNVRDRPDSARPTAQATIVLVLRLPAHLLGRRLRPLRRAIRCPVHSDDRRHKSV
jgi:hypothetical protein